MTQDNEQRINKLERDVEELKKQVQDLTQKTKIDYIYKEVNRRLGQELRRCM